tara:strand:+ start:30808 stop:31572 length:765 start_codon:yes stop_codon:yes gene_type:complete
VKSLVKVSIITVSLNSEHTIRQCIDSVLNQTYKNIEYIIIDGMSSDKTIKIIDSYRSKLYKFVSEKDEGLYDAMNKGIKLATGDIVGILNSDDEYFNENVIENIVEAFSNKEADSLYGDLCFVDPNNTRNVKRFWKSSEFKHGSFKKGWHPPHPTFFVKKDIYNKYGLFDTNLRISADFDLMLRFLEKHKISTTYFPSTLVRMKIGGESTKSLKNIWISNKSILQSFDKNGIQINKFFYVFKRLLLKILQITFR